MVRVRARHLLLFYALILSVALVAAAQTPTAGRLTGTVKDPSGAVIAGAEILAKDSQTGAQFRAVTNGAGVWVMVILAGMLMDGFMALFTTMLLETEGVGPALSGTAIGVVFTVAQLGSTISPPIGNALEAFGGQWPFIFWAVLGAVALIPFVFTRETGRRRLKTLNLKP